MMFKKLKESPLFNQVKGVNGPTDIIEYVDYDHLAKDDELVLKIYNKSIFLSKKEIDVICKKEQLTLRKDSFPGIQFNEMLNAMSANEIESQIIFEALDKITEFGKKNFDQGLKDSWNPNIIIDRQTIIKNELNKLKVSFWSNPFKWFASIFKPKVIVIDESQFNILAAQRRLISKILALSNYIATTCKLGPANICIVSAQLGAAIQDSSMFIVSPQNAISNNSSFPIYRIGSLCGISIYVNSNLKYNDGHILVMRQGKNNEPGIHVVYQENYGKKGIETSEIIAERTMAPKIKTSVNINIAEVGFKPELNYVVAEVNLGEGNII